MDRPYCCPRCRGDVSRDADAYACNGCGSTYPVVCGIPDFRVFPDPYIGLEDDRAKARHMAGHAESSSLEELIAHYYAITPEVPTDRARAYTQGMLVTGPRRASSSLAFVDRVAGAQPSGSRVLESGSRVQPSGSRVLEVGTGSGTYLGAIAARFRCVTAVDIALRWLVVARKRLEECGLQAEIVCACAEYLPFPEASYDLVVAANVVEHVAQPEQMLDEIWRVLDPDGMALLETPNRWSPRPDPHLGIWGLGALPRSWQVRLARRLRGLEIDKVQTRNVFELRALFEGRGFRRLLFAAPELPTSELRGLQRALGGLYNAARRLPGARGLLQLAGPSLQVLAFKGAHRQGS